MMMKNIKKAFTLSLVFVLALTMISGCGDNTDFTETETVELIEPVGVATNYATVTKMNFYDTSVYGANVYPWVEEYAFRTTQNFKSYAVLPGDTVDKKDVLIYANTESIDKQIDSMKDSLDSMLESYTDYMTEALDSLEENEDLYEKYGEYVDNFERMNDSEKASYGSGLAFYYSEYAKYDTLWRQTYIAIERLKEQMKEKSELHVLDYNYKQSQYKALKAKRKEATLTADTSGTVVGITYFDAGNRMNADAPVIAIGDTGVKELITEYINKGIMKKALDVYAIINGKRYEVEYQAIDNEEYDRLSEANGTVYSHFILNDPNDEVEFGTFATVVVVNDRADDRLCVPYDAINKDEDNGYFVYRYDGENSEKVYVKTGLTNGNFTEIVSGLSEGDVVLSEFRLKTGSKTATITKGSLGNEFSQEGYIYYPTTEWVTNPVKYGTCYVDEILVSMYQRVEKGQVIARIHVEKNEIDLLRKQRTMLRAQEKLEELRDAKRHLDEGDDSMDEAIEIQTQAILDQYEVILDIENDAKTVEIIAPFSGIITGLQNYREGDLIFSNSNICEIAEENSSYVLVEDTNSRLTYGNIATITYNDINGEKRTAHGTVVTVGNNALSKNMQVQYSMISIPKEEIADMAGSAMSYDGWWNRSRFTASVITREMNNVLVVPKSAVTEVNGCTYVCVLNADGSVSAVTFVAGGSDTNNYWIVEGLTEGMIVCLE